MVWNDLLVYVIWHLVINSFNTINGFTNLLIELIDINW